MLDAIKKIYGIEYENDKNKKSTNYNIVDDKVKWSPYSLQDKQSALALYEKLGSFPEVEKSTGISRSAVRQWHDRYNIKNVLQNVDDLYPELKLKSKGLTINATARQKLLIESVKNKALATKSLVKLLGVTDVTVRNDVKYLLGKGAIKDISQNPRARVVIAV